MSVYSDLEKIKQIKKQIHTSIANKEVAIADDLPFDQYPSKIDKITGGGGSISGQEFTITNNTGSDIKQGDMVWVDWAPYVESESKITNIKSYNAPTILDPSGRYAYTGINGQFFSIDDLTPVNSQSDFSSLASSYHYTMSDNGELFYSTNSSMLAGDGYGGIAYRSDSIYCEYSNLKIPNDTYGTKKQAILYAGENFFIRTAKSPGDGYPYIQLFQIDTATGNILKQWRPGNSYTEASDIAYFGTSSWIFRENGKVYLIDFYHGMKYELNMNSIEENPIVEGTACQALGIIAVKGLTKDGKYMIVSGRVPVPGQWSDGCPFQIYRKGSSIDEWSLLSFNDLSMNLSGYYNNYLYPPFYNPVNQVVTLFNNTYSTDMGYEPGKAFRYIGENESGKMLWEELPCDLSKFTPDKDVPDTSPDNLWAFGPTYSQDCGKYVMFKYLAGGERVREYQVGYAKTGIFLEAVKDPSKLGAFAIQGVAKQNIANNSSGKIVTLALEKVNIQLKSDVELDDILVSTGV